MVESTAFAASWTESTGVVLSIPIDKSPAKRPLATPNTTSRPSLGVTTDQQHAAKRS